MSESLLASATPRTQLPLGCLAVRDREFSRISSKFAVRNLADDHGHGDAHSPDTGPPAHDVCIERNAFEHEFQLSRLFASVIRDAELTIHIIPWRKASVSGRILRDFQEFAVFHGGLMRNDAGHGHVQAVGDIDVGFAVFENRIDELLAKIAV